MKKTIITIVIALAVVTGVVFVLKGNQEKMQSRTELAKKTNETIPVEVADVKEEKLSGSFTATGSFKPDQELTLVSEGSGKIVSISVKEGEFVNKGQVLARLEYEVKEAEFKSAEASFTKLTTDKQRYENLIKTGGVSQSQLDEVNIGYINAETRLATAKKNLSDTYIRAPFGGYINKKYIEIGSYLSQQSNKTFDLVDISRLKLVINVTESQVLTVSKTNDIKVTADVYPDANYSAKVNFIGAKADATLNYPVELSITNIKNKPLRAGMYGRASFSIPNEETSLVIPREALIGSVNDAKVYVLEKDAVKLKSIVTGRQFASQVEVLGGLSAGDRVITNGQINLSEGSKVSVL